MKQNEASLQEQYYDRYWEYRIAKGRVHTREGMWIPQRIQIAARMIIHDVRQKKPKSIRVLDIGCGEGTTGKLLKEKLALEHHLESLLIGCDISKNVLRLASSHYSKVLQFDIEKDDLPEEFRKDKFDYVIVLDTLEHLLRPDTALQKCYSLLKDSGSLVASFPNIAWYKYRIRLLAGRFPSDYLFGPSDHLQQFTLFSFVNLLERSGFDVGEIDGQFNFPRLFRPRRLFLPLGKRFPNLFGYQLVVKARKSDRSDNKTGYHRS